MRDSTCFWAAAPKGPMTYAFSHRMISILSSFSFFSVPPLEAQIPASRLKSQPQGSNPSIKAQKSQCQGLNPNLEAQILDFKL